MTEEKIIEGKIVWKKTKGAGGVVKWEITHTTEQGEVNYVFEELPKAWKWLIEADPKEGWVKVSK